jgi:hypothetical protein
MPKPLQAFIEADWQEWMLEGPDPAADAYVDMEAFYALPHPVTRQVFRGTGLPAVTRTETVGIGDRPELVAYWRHLDAHRRWTAARRAWLEAAGHHDLAFDTWLDDVSYRNRVLRPQFPD